MRLFFRTYKYIFLLLLILHVNRGSTQKSNVLEYSIDTISVSTSRSLKNTLDTPNNKWYVDSTVYQYRSTVAKLLETESGVYIKNYGPGSLSTLSVRGGNSSQTSILWNGVPIISPMLGIIDMALLSSDLFQTIDLTLGGGSSLWGSGAISGTLNLNNQASYTYVDQISLSTSIGNYGLFSNALDLKISRPRWEWNSSYHLSQAENDFTYNIPTIDKVFKQSNASYYLNNFLTSGYFKPNDYNEISVHYWKQWNMREIPPTTTQTKSIAYQKDISDRILTRWISHYRNLTIESSASVISDQQQYVDNEILIDSKNNFQSYFLESGISTSFFNTDRLYAGLSSLWNTAKTTNYKNQATNHRLAGLIDYSYRYHKMTIRGSVRNEIENLGWNPVIVSSSINYQPSTQLILRGKISKNYRSPTLNDQYWNPGGNLLLLPESGWSQEVNLDYSPVKTNVSSGNITLGIYNRVIDNWILWAISDGNNFFSPQNIAQVWSRGFESTVSYACQTTFGEIRVQSNYNFTKSTNQKSILSPNIAAGDQLVYTPEHKAIFNISLNKKNTFLSINHVYTSSVKGFNERVAAFWIGNLYLSHQIKNQNEITLFIKCNNIWNKNYRIVERRPMPGINFELGIRNNINKTH